jgi:hypothetical protein
VPADDQKGYPHHHGGCHGHQLFEVWPTAALPTYATAKAELNSVSTTFLASTDPGPTLRPPIA